MAGVVADRRVPGDSGHGDWWAVLIRGVAAGTAEGK